MRTVLLPLMLVFVACSLESAYRGLLAVIGLKIPHFTTDSGTKDSVKPPAIDWMNFAPSLPIEESLSFGFVVSNLPHPLNERRKPILELV